MAHESSCCSVNENPSSNPEYSELKSENVHSTNDTIRLSALNRPPKPPGPALGPYFQFITTDLEKMLWIGSALIFRHVSLDQPKIEFISEAKIDYNWEVLYENLFNMRAYRINLQVELRNGDGDEKVRWIIDWGDYSSDAIFYIARYDQKWRGGFFSCNGFDSSVSTQIIDDFNYDNVWNHLHSIHKETPLHILLWGGDQIYIDFIFEDIPFLRDWTHMGWDQRWTYDFDNDSKKEVEQYYFNAYAETWECRLDVKHALQSIPSLMMWDDHDIFDGAGSYPPLLKNSPIMTGLFNIAQKMRLLFQHHTTPEKARQDGLFGYQAYNSFARCGPKLAILGADGRSERDVKTVHHEKTWSMIFNKLDHNLQGVEHLIVLFPVPFSFVRLRLAESVFDTLTNLPNKWRNIPFIKQTNSIFGLTELYDDLLDRWVHKAHIAERDQALLRFQKIAEKKKVRITFFGGDVHCCCISRFRTTGHNVPLPINDTKLMYQIISSAIVNMPPSRKMLHAAHFGIMKWHPIENTEEEIMNFFDRVPENGRKSFFQKLSSNRNWCYFEQCVTTNSTIAVHYENEQRNTSMINQQKQFVQEINSLKVRLWLESTEKKTDGRQFAGYDLFILNLK